MKLIAALLGMVTLSIAAQADTLKLKNGSVIEGMLLERSSESITFDVAGNKMTFKTADIASIELSFAQTAPAQAASPAPATKPSTAIEINKIPAGTPLLVNLDNLISTDRHKAGHRFSAHLEGDLVIQGSVVAAHGSKIYGKVLESKKAGRLVGKSFLRITLDDITINGQRIPIRTESLSAGGKGSGGNTLGKVAVGAGIGAIANGSKGAKTGAAIGGGVALLTKGKQIQVPAGTLIEFQLSADANLP